MSVHPFEDGLDAVVDVDSDRAIAVPGVSVCTSKNAGNYYCAHAFYVLARWADAAGGNGRRAPGVGFLHVPADEATTGDAPAGPDRHAQTSTVIAAALRGVLDAHPDVDALRVLLTGYGPFQGVVDNPTGAFVSDGGAILQTLATATKLAPAEVEPLAERGARVRRFRAGRLELCALVLDVSDHALDADAPGSLPWALETLSPDIALSMGVHRASTSYRVELLPTDGGLVALERGARHEANRPASMRLREQPLLAYAIERGARSLRDG